MTFVDSHCHINDEKLINQAEEVFRTAKENNVGLFLVVGWDLPSSLEAIKIAESNEGAYAAIGFHPSNLEDISEEKMLLLKDKAKFNKVVAIGEIGLDYYWTKDEKEKENQRKWFIRQLELANELNLPVSIHARDALADTLTILKEHPPLQGGSMHCFGGSKEMMQEFLKLGLYIGFDGPVTYKNASNVKENALLCPLENILTETDSPYLSPVPYRGTINEPKNIRFIVQEIANIKGLSLDEAAKQIENNFKRLFHVKL